MRLALLGLLMTLHRAGAYGRAFWRLIRLAWTVLTGWWWVRFDFPGLSAPDRDARISEWALRMLAAMGVRWELSGSTRVQGPVLVVANHISWTDILALLATGACQFVAKAQVHHWPVVGTMAAGAGTLFIERESPRDVMRVMHHMAEVLSAKGCVAVFPEGTTSTGQTVGLFHANLLQAAISAQAPVQALALAYFDAQGQHCSPQVAFVGDDDLTHSLRALLLAPSCVVKIAVAPAMAYKGQNRREWAAQLQQQVQALHANLIH